MKIQTKFFLFIALVTIISITTGFFSLHRTVQIIEENEKETLDQVVHLKENVLETYINETIAIGDFFQQSEPVQEYIETSEPTTELEEQVLDILYSFQETQWGKYHHMFIINKNKIIILSPNHGEEVKGSPSSHLDENTSKNQWANQAFQTGEITISDYSSWIESDHSHQMMFYPLKDSKGVSQLVVGFEMQIPYELEILSEDVNLGETGKIFIVSSNGTTISYKLPEQQTTVNTLGVKEARNNGYFAGESTNEEGEEIIGIYNKHDVFPWILGFEITQKEAFSDSNRIKIFHVISTSISVILVILIALLFKKNLVNKEEEEDTTPSSEEENIQE